MSLSRRDFLMRVGQAGGYGAAFMTMQTLGLMAPRSAAALPLTVAPGTGKGVKVVILGGGIAGLVAAYEMKALGYDCTILEARERPAAATGPCAAATKSTSTTEATQTCTFDRATTRTSDRHACRPFTPPCSATAASSAWSSKLK